MILNIVATQEVDKCFLMFNQLKYLYMLILPIGTICTYCILHIHRPAHQPLYHTIFNQFGCESFMHIHNEVCQIPQVHSQL